MPGITGIINKIIDDNNEKIDLMVNSMLHEKYYSSGTYLNKEIGVSVGWVCHKGSFSDCQPVWNETKDICLIFSGENYIDESEVMNLKAKGHEFNSNDASYLVHLYEEQGLRFYENLNGHFCGLLIDIKEKKIVLFNDRFGLSRIYYHENDKGFYFSSEAKSIINVLPELKELDISRMAELFSLGFILNNKSIFPKISLLPGGSKWFFHPDGSIKKEAYFQKETWENQSQLNDKDYYQKLKEIFPQLLKRYFQGKQKIGMSLTGGIDSRMIMAWAPCSPFEVPCYTFGGLYRDCADVKIGKKVASACLQTHETISMQRDFFSQFPALVEKSVTYSDGAMNVSGSVELYMNRKAREIASVRLTGNHGDQVIRTDIGARPIYLYKGIFDQEFIKQINTAEKFYDQTDENPLSFYSFKQVPRQYYPRFVLEQSQQIIRSPFLDNDLVALSYRTSSIVARSIELSLRFIADGDPVLAKIPTDRGDVYKPVPIIGAMRRLYQEYTKKAEYAYDYGMPQWLARIDNFFKLLHFQKLFLGRQKFYHFRVWYRNELSQYVKDLILDPCTLDRPYFQGKNLENMVKDHIDGLRNYTQEIHWVLTSELIQRYLIEKKYIHD